MECLESRQLLSATTTVLLRDDFSGGSVNAKNWHIPYWTPDGSTFLGRTQLAVSQNASPPRVSGGAVHLTLDTFNPTGFSFYGTELISNRTFKIGTGLDVKIRAKLNAPIPGGIVGGLFLYMVKPDGTNHDEVDTELLSNQIANGGNKVHTNVFANEPLGAGSPLLAPLPRGGKLAGYHTYQMKCEPGRVTWYVDGVRVRIERHRIPAGPVRLRLNIWAPAREWTAAYNGRIQPTSTPANNKRYGMDVDSVLVKTVQPGK